MQGPRTLFIIKKDCKLTQCVIIMAHRQRPQENMHVSLCFSNLLCILSVHVYRTRDGLCYIPSLWIIYIHNVLHRLGVVTSAFRLRNETFTEIGRMSPQLPEVWFMSDLLLYAMIFIIIYTWNVRWKSCWSSHNITSNNMIKPRWWIQICTKDQTFYWQQYIYIYM